MTLSLTHTFVSAIPDGADATVVRPSNWNDTHTIAGTLPIANGGTNTASIPGNGQLLIGNGTDYTVANLTAGTGVTITNTAGGISIAAPDNGTVTAVTASSPIASSGGTAPNISLTGTVPVANGGTGQTTYTDGQLLIGNTTGNTLAKATLTAGTGVTITNGAGTITISAPDTGTVTSVTASSPLASSGGATPNLSLTGTVAIANGGTAGTATPTAGAIPYGTGTAYAFNAAGTTGQVLTSAGAGAPTWTTPTTGTVTSVTASSPLASSGGATPNLSLTGTVAVANGGTAGTATPTAGAIAYGTGTAYAFSAAGTSGQILLSGATGSPTWATLSSSAVTSFNAGTTGLTPSSATTGAVTLAGTLAIANGGTNSTATATAGGAGYGTGTAHAYTAAGTLGQVLTSAGAGTPTWTTLTTGVSSVSNSDGTLTVSPTTGAVVASLALGHANSWSGVQTFTTPVLGAATGTSLALGGATIGTNALAVTGTSTFSSTVTHSGATTLSGALTYGGVTLSNAVTGTGSMVLATSPSFTTPAIGAATATTPAQGNSSTSVATTAFVNGMSKFSAYLNANQSVATGYQKITLDTTLYNVGSNFSTSTSVYTAPVTGYYLFTFAFSSTGAVTASEFEVFLQTTTDSYYTFFSNSVTETAGWARSGAVVCFMTAADTAYLRVYTATSLTAASGHTSAHCFLTGQLVGA